MGQCGEQVQIHFQSGTKAKFVRNKKTIAEATVSTYRAMNSQ